MSDLTFASEKDEKKNSPAAESKKADTPLADKQEDPKPGATVDDGKTPAPKLPEVKPVSAIERDPKFDKLDDEQKTKALSPCNWHIQPNGNGLVTAYNSQVDLRFEGPIEDLNRLYFR